MAKTLSFLLLITPGVTASAALAQSLPASVSACLKVSDATARLACFDKEVARYSQSARHTYAGAPAQAPASVPAGAATAAPAPTSSEAGAVSQAPPEETAEDRFGMTEPLKRKSGAAMPAKLDRLTRRIASVSSTAAGAAVVRLDNGQVWQEAETSSHLPLRSGDTVTIQRGLLGAFYLSTQTVLGMRVKRLQ